MLNRLPVDLSVCIFKMCITMAEVSLYNVSNKVNNGFNGNNLHVGMVYMTYVTRSTEMRNKSGHVKSGKSTSKSIGDGFVLKC